uniref:Leukemia NUP98 fusion partner 1 n=1 Tax=Gopherus evgoodei TaxID=1825980 RepID=A0A8C4W1S8_9SAUR
MEYEEDDDISFAKWMSSFWGHSLIDENEKEGRSYRKRQTQALSERRASLPVRSVLIPSSHRHARASSHQGQDVKCHCHTKACKISSPDGSGSTSRSNAIQEFSESFEKQLHFKIKRSVSLVEKIFFTKRRCDCKTTKKSVDGLWNFKLILVQHLSRCLKHETSIGLLSSITFSGPTHILQS